MKLCSVLATASLLMVGSMMSASAGLNPIAVPEPMTAGLLAAGAAGLYALRKFRGK
jgi:hypothetical protein